MSSARRPLWLRWTNGSEYAEHYFPTFDLIFKNGDGTKKIKVNLPIMIMNSFLFFCLDLRQDMLALQFIQMMDILWKTDGLDLRFDEFV
jgi:phosphatidylinositol-4,5-bisphosphate 3-kinase